MIEVEDLWKSYGSTAVLRGLRFTVEAGQVAGFLGANGAGKTTAMRVLTTYHPPQRGRVRVAGHDVVQAPGAVCTRVGYLPESMPIYPELRVDEYLRFRAVLRGFSRRQARSRVAEVVEECALTEVRRRLLGALSRGYRQRLGLADALLHDPPVLILDEPTAGLDPRQVVEVRRMIASFHGRRTVLLSSHILGEIEQICDQVIILHDGRIQAQESRASWEARRESSTRLRLVLEQPPPVARGRLAALPEVEEVTREGDAFLLRTRADARRAVARLVREQDWQLLELTPIPVRLEDLFLEITRDDAGREAS